MPVTMVRKALNPEQQGHIDGMCAVYSVLNACKLLFDHSEKLDAQLFSALCEGTPNLFPKIVYDGTEVDGILRLLKAAKTWTKHIHKCELICSQPMRRKTIATVEDYFACVRSTLDGGDGERKAAIIGLGKPWDHWTVVRRVDRRRAVFFDSWGFPRTTGFDYFTFDKTKAGEGAPLALVTDHATEDVGEGGANRENRYHLNQVREETYRRTTSPGAFKQLRGSASALRSDL